MTHSAAPRFPRSAVIGTLAAAMFLGSMPVLAQTNAAASAAAGTAATPDPVARIGELSRIRREAGLKICRDSADGKLSYAGFVQDAEQGNIKVEIAAEYDKTTGAAIADFHPVNVWDAIDNWTICPK